MKLLMPHSLSLRRSMAGVGILCLGFGAFLYRAQGPDVPQATASILAAFLLFLGYFCAQTSWGNLLWKAAGSSSQIWESFFLGSALFALLIGVFGWLPILGEAAKPGWLIFLGLGCAADFLLTSPEEKTSIKIHSTDLLAAIVLILAFLGAFTPHAFWDSLWYHLTASRLWFENGKIYLPPNFPVALQTGLWDYHFTIGQILLGQKAEGGGLIAAQLFGQWASLACFGFTYVVLRSLGASIGLSPLAALVGIIGTEIFLEAEFAKNDWPTIFWGLCAIAFVLRRSTLLAAFAAGACFAGKFSSSFFLLPWLACLAWEERKDAKKLAAACAVFLLAALPLLARNFLLTKDPFFPTLTGIFPTDQLGPSWKNISVYQGFTFQLSSLKEKICILLLDSKALLGLLALPFAWKALAPGRKILGFSAISAVLFLFFSGPKAEWRIAGAYLPLLAAYGARALEGMLQRLPRAAPWAPLFLAGFFLWISPLDWKAPMRLDQDPALQIRSWATGAAMAWVRMNAPAEAQVATLHEQRIYYLFPRSPMRAFDQPRIDAELAKAKSTDELVRVFLQEKIRYLILSAEYLDLFFDRRVCDEFFALSERYPEAVVFRSDLSRVLDLDKIPIHK